MARRTPYAKAAAKAAAAERAHAKVMQETDVKRRDAAATDKAAQADARKAKLDALENVMRPVLMILLDALPDDPAELEVSLDALKAKLAETDSTGERYDARLAKRLAPAPERGGAEDSI